jgi:pyruvate dehydrogenase E2 component (dihydrolipoamide acetyltransferase)
VIALTVPKLSMTMEEATVVAWLVDDGAEVREGQGVVEIETDKAQEEVVAPADGVLRIVAAPGTQVPLDGLLAELHGADPPPPAPPADDAAANAGVGGVMASPAARRVARELGVELTLLRGSGPGGRITVADVEAAAPAAPPDSAAVEPSRKPAPAKSLRSAVLANIVASWQQVPHVHISGELVADGLEAARRLAAGQGRAVTVTDLLIVALAGALGEVPELNGTIGGDGAPRRAPTIDLSLAVAAPEGVVAPALRDVGAMALAGVAAERARLVAAARAGTLAPRDLAAGSVTLSNLGAHPVDFFAPVVTGPQIATIATGRVLRKPVAIGDALGLGTRVTVNVAIDHRGADGEAGGRLLAALERRLAALPAHV